jgi:hypothetical protein
VARPPPDRPVWWWPSHPIKEKKNERRRRTVENDRQRDHIRSFQATLLGLHGRVPAILQFLFAHNMVRAYKWELPLMWDSDLEKYARWWAGQRKSDCKVYCVQPACIEPSCIQPPCVAPTTCFEPRLFSSKSKKDRKPKNEMGNQVSPLPKLIAEPTNARSMSFVGTHEYLAP